MEAITVIGREMLKKVIGFLAKIFKIKKNCGEAAKYAQFEKYLYGILFERGTGKILLTEVNGRYWLPGGGVFLKDVSGFGEGWKRRYFSVIIPGQTGVSAYFIEYEVQDMSANYEVYPPGKKEEHSAIIIGYVNSLQTIKAGVKFYDVEDLKRLVKEGKIVDDQALLILRAFVSRDCHNKDYREQAVPLLKEILKQRLFLERFCYFGGG